MKFNELDENKKNKVVNSYLRAACYYMLKSEISNEDKVILNEMKSFLIKENEKLNEA